MQKTESYPHEPLPFIHYIVKQAAKGNATDIHWEPLYENNMLLLVVRFRIDGLLKEIVKLERKEVNFDSIVNALKTMCGMDTTKKRREQDGRTSFNVDGLELDLRFSCMPVVSGEKIVIRIIYKEQFCKKLEDLGITPDGMKLLVPLISRKEGFVLIVGPTGAGKSTTLYAILNYIYSRQKNICTIEDPVECMISGFNQIQVEHGYGMTFVSSLRAIMRQDPDIIALGEVRDAETARTAFQAALAGSLIFSTLHAKDCVNAIIRLLQMGVEPYFISAALTGVVSVRLIRLLCRVCKGEGCMHCANSGFKKRIGVFEIMKVTEKIKNLILEGASHDALRKAAVEAGMSPFQDVSGKMVSLGLTSKEEADKLFTLDEIG